MIISRYELKRTLTSKVILILVPIMIVLSSLIAYGTLLTQQSPEVRIATVVKDNTLHVYIFAYSRVTGIPLSNVQASVTYGNTTLSGNTNSSGILELKFRYSPDVQQPLRASYSYGLNAGVQFVAITNTTMGYISPIPVGENIVRLVVIFVPPNGIFKGNLSIYYKISSSFSLSNLLQVDNVTQTLNNFNFLANVTQFFRTFDLKLPNSSVTLFVIGVYNGKLVLYSLLPPNSTPVNLSLFNTYFILSPVASIIPLMIVILSYSLYAKDKYSGVLEFLLARPVTRAGLLMTRYIGISLGTMVAILITVIIVTIISTLLFGLVLSPFGLVVFTLSIIAESIALLGFFILVSQLTSSSGLYLGISIGLWIIFSFFYNLIIIFVYIFTQNNILLNVLYYLNIINYYGLIGILVNAVPSTFLSFSNIIYVSPAVTITTLLIWIVLPIILSVQLVRKRD
ncbi:MAG: ABC transporter permease subunit [Sulfolobaceae archaeon]